MGRHSTGGGGALRHHGAVDPHTRAAGPCRGARTAAVHVCFDSPSGDAVGSANDAGVEHGGHPELAGDESREAEADHHASSDEAAGVGHGGHRKGSHRGEELQRAVAVAGAQRVADCGARERGEGVSSLGSSTGVGPPPPLRDTLTHVPMYPAPHPIPHTRWRSPMPSRMREKTAPQTEAVAAALMSCLVRLRSLRIWGIRGGAAKVAKKAIMNDIHESWKARWCGLPKLQMRSTLDLRRGGG